MSTVDVLICGGGVSGLAAAYYLGRLGIRSILFEKQRLGGLIRTDLIEGCRLEAGPDSYIASKPSVAKLAGELGELGRQVISSNDAARRVFIVRKGTLVPLPAGMVMMVPGKWGPALRSPLFSWSTRLRFMQETFTPPRERGDVSVGEFVSDHFGREVLELVTEPLLAGVYGGESAELSAESVLPRFLGYEQRFGSLIRGVRSQEPKPAAGGLFRSFRDGMQSLTDCLAEAVRPFCRVIYSEATRVEREGSGWRVRAGGETARAGAVVLACPAKVSGDLLAAGAPDLAEELRGISYSSSILVTLLFDGATFGRKLDGFGFLVPAAERKTLAAATWINTKFPSRIAPGWVALRGFIVGQEATRAMGTPDPELARLVEDDFRRLMGMEDRARHFVVTRWPDSMPQYVVGHGARQQRILDRLKECPGLKLIGNSYDGVGIPDCVRLARETAEQISGSIKF